MARVVLSPQAQDGSDRIITGLARSAGPRVAQRYAGDLDALYDHPDIGSVRPRLGQGVRIGVVAPHVAVYAHDRIAAMVTILRIVHGKRRISRGLLGVPLR